MCRLVKSLYGLKQVPKQWHNKFDHVLLTNDFFINNFNKCIYNKLEKNACIIGCLYIDDMVVFEASSRVIYKTNKFLGSNFDLKDLEETEVILGIKIITTLN